MNMDCTVDNPAFIEGYTCDPLSPPPFICQSNYLNDDLIKLRKAWKKDMKEVISCLESIFLEFEILDGFLERKGTQLRLEKALLATIKVFKGGNKARKEKYLQNIFSFDEAFCDLDTYSGKKKKKKSSSLKLPTKQWVYWIIYLTMRKLSLLIKIASDCEVAGKYWLGLISAAHHWSDSFVALAAISRIWKLSNTVIDIIVGKTYPTLLQLSEGVNPSRSKNSPFDVFQPPEDLKNWLKIEMRLGISPTI